ncbi:CxxxxCH/CxxCH domain c-type cytochrome [Anaeromyxobacter oryzisoli]|uniref:CxxxxCH/CxxCH domain c-type cytochrome n=1 Tax=Anaeromyxobacter oryzisoli TaxID=2925408 RepID=UPI001F56B019|nr:CxxxxCH/CxxCH domain-containing protein [Anaeromyxobacter sp. SG63]
MTTALLLGLPDPALAVTVTSYATTNAVVTTGWTVPTNAYAADASYATATPSGRNVSITSDFGGFGFDTSIPAGSTINSVTIEVAWYASTAASVANLGLQPVANGGTLSGTEAIDSSEPATTTAYTAQFTGLTRADLLDGGASPFMARVRANRGASNTSFTAYLDYVRVTVDYTPSVIIGNGSDPTGTTVSAGSTAVLDTFTLSTSTSSTTVNAVATSLTGNTALTSLSLWTGAGCTGTNLATVTSPGPTPSFSGLSLPASTTSASTTYYVCGTAATVAADTTVSVNVTGVTPASGTWGVTDSDTGPSFTVAAPVLLTIGNGSSADPAGTALNAGTTTALDYFTLATSTGTSTVSAIAVQLTGNTALSSLELRAGTGCGGALVGSAINGPGSAPTFSGLTQSIGTTATSYTLCGTGAVVASSTIVNANVSGVTYSGAYTVQDGDAANDFTVNASSLTIGNGSDPTGTTISAGSTVVLDTFTLSTSASSTTVTAVATALTGSTALTSLDLWTGAGCTGTNLASVTSPGAAPSFGSVSLPASTTSGSTTYYLCGTAAAVGTSTTVAVHVTGATAASGSWAVTDGDTGPSFTVSASAGTITIGNGSAEPTSQSLSSGQTLALDTFTLGSTATATVTEVKVSLTNGGALSAISVQSSSTCSGGTVYGTLSSPVSGNNTIPLTTSITARTNTGNTDRYLCATGGTVGSSTAVTGTAYAATATGFAWVDNDTTSATLTVLAAAPSNQTTLVPGTDPAGAVICPGATTPVYLDQLGFTVTGTADTIGTVTFQGLGASAPLASIELRDSAGAALSPARTGTPTGDTYTFGAASLGAPVGTTYYRLYGTAKGHAALASGTYTVQPRVQSYTSSNTQGAGADTANAFTVDNQAPAEGTWGTVTPGDNQVQLAWTNPTDAALSQIVVLRRKTSTAFTETLTDGAGAPTEGSTTSGGSTVVYSRAGTSGGAVSFTDTSAVDGNTYVYRLYAMDGCGNFSAGVASGPWTPAGAFVAEGSTVPGAPMVSIVNPLTGSTVSGTFRVQIRVFNSAAQGGIAGLTANSLAYSLDNGTTWSSTNLTALTAYDTLSGGVLTGRTYEVQLTPAAGGHTLRAKASNAVATDVLSNGVALTVAATSTGDGNLLVRDNSAQLCTDCHALQGHTSEVTGSARGSWSTTCRDCHTPHGTTNLSLVAPQITPPAITGAQSAKTVSFLSKSGYAASSYASSANNGPCQVCHTQTQYYRADGTSPGGSHETGPCSSCHAHAKGLAATCTTCHGTEGRGSIAGADAKQPGAPPAVATGATVFVANGGAHVAHVNQASLRAAPLACASCHPSPNTHQSPSQTDVAWAGLASTGGLTPTPAAGAVATAWTTAPTCSNYCHGASLTRAAGSKTTPAWNGASTDAACGTCHAVLPPVGGATAGVHPQNQGCATCHGAGYAYNAGAGSVVDPARSKHIDGTLDRPNGCTACHGKLTGTSGTVVPSGDPQAAPGYDALSVDTRGSTDRAQLGVGAHVKHVNAGLMSAKSCSVCHGSTPADEAHANGAVAIGWSAPANAGGVTPTWASPNCTNYCHSSGKPIGGTVTPAAAIAWTSQTALGCTSCHASTGLATNGHAKHVSTYGIGCQACHAATTDTGASIVSGGGAHVNGANDVSFAALDAYVGGGNYDTLAYTCSNTYCHSNGQDRSNPFTSGPSRAWNGGAGGCSACHATGTALATGSHAAHVNHDGTSGFGANSTCQQCHAGTTADGATIASTTLHVNMAADVDSTHTYSSAAKSCATYCHSSGQGGTATPQKYSDMAWGIALTNDCMQCHGRYSPADFTSRFGEPNYANGGAGTATANSHGAHVKSAADCYTCHKATVTAAGNAIATGATTHTDGNRQVLFDGATAGTGATYSNDANKRCSNVSCHGSGTPQWGGASLLCSDCHVGASDTNSFAFGTAGIVNTTEWTSVGHGKTSIGAAATPCLYCHDGSTSAPHDSTTNPFRLRGATGTGGAVTNGNYSALTASSANQVCLNCHAASGANGVDPDGVGANPLITGATKIDAYHYGAAHTAAGTTGGARCWDCHDPHGDGSNIKMIGADVVKTSTDNHSWAAARTPGVTFTADATGTDFANTSATSLCRACHTTAAHYNATTNDGHNSGARCVACHAHEQTGGLAFHEATTCNACHNAPPTLGKHGSHDETTFTETSYTNAARHGSATQYGFACNTCHAGTHQDSNNPYSVQVVFGSFDAKAVGGTYAAGTAQTADTAPTGSLSFKWTNGTCSSTYCHSNATPLGGTNLGAAPTWNETAWVKTGGTANECTKCHQMAADSTGASTSTKLSHAHFVHTAATSASGYYFGCAQCHYGEATGQADYPTTAATIADKTRHVNGARDVAFDATFNPGTTGYNQGPAYTCANTYCHSNGTNASSPPVNTSIAWSASATCASCHGGYTGTIIGTGKHTNHVDNGTLGESYHCDDCHATTVTGGATPVVSYTGGKHVNRTKDVSIAARGTYTDTTDTGTTCSAAYCHSDGQRGAANTKVTVTWADAAWTGSVCVKCHGGTTGSLFGAPDYANGGKNTATANSHARHVSAATSCATCHKTTTTTGAAILAGGLHTNGTIEIAFDTTKAGTGASAAPGSFTSPSTYVSATCTNIACHGNNATAISWGDTTLSCTSCHSGAADTNNWNIGDGTPAVIGTGTEWTTYGHGSTSTTGNSFSEFGAVASADRCVYCHDNQNAAASHQQATNPFRLRGAATSTGATNAYSSASVAAVNAVCFNCHATSTSVAYGVDPDGTGALPKVGPATARIDAYHAGGVHSATLNGGERCWDCHDPHGDATNLKMIGSDTMQQGSDVHGLTGTRSTTPAVFTTTSGYANTTTRNGVCQICHTTTKYWQYNSEPAAHNAGSTCTAACHLHNQPPNLAFKGAGDCLGCHGKATSGTIPRAQIVGGSLGFAGDDFLRPSRHVSNGALTGTPIVTNFDCILCHAEGDPTSTGTNVKTVPTLHGGDSQTVKTVDLRDVDSASGGTVAAPWPGSRGGATARAFVGGADPLTNDRDRMDTFCLRCHDSNGAAGIAVNATNDGMQLSTNPTTAPVGRATTPFNTNDTRVNAHDTTAINALRTRVLDVRSQFNSGNLSGKNFASHHQLKQFTRRYTTVNANWPATAWTAYVTKEGQTLNASTVRETAQLHCSDCHLNEANAHGTRTTWYMLADSSFSDATADNKFLATGSPTGTDSCFRCHAPGTYGEGAANATTQSRTDAHTGSCPRIDGPSVQTNLGANIGYDNSGDATHQIPCLMCHAGGGLGYIHGMNFTYKPYNGTVTSKTYRFQGGGGTWRWYSPKAAAPANATEAETMWESGTTTGGCYTLGGANPADTYGGCTQHSTGAKTFSPNYARPLQY